MYRVRARTLADYAAIEARIVQLRGNPCDVLRWQAAHGWGAEYVQDRLKKLLQGWWHVTLSESSEWLKTWEGRIYGLWLATGADYDLVLSSAESSDWEQIQDALDCANGDDEVALLDMLEKSHAEQGAHWSWQTVYDILCKEPFAVSPVDVPQMTLWQVLALCGKKTEFHSEGEARAFELTRQANIRDAVNNISQGKHWGAK